MDTEKYMGSHSLTGSRVAHLIIVRYTYLVFNASNAGVLYSIFEELSVATTKKLILDRC